MEVAKFCTEEPPIDKSIFPLSNNLGGEWSAAAVERDAPRFTALANKTGDEGREEREGWGVGEKIFTHIFMIFW